MKSIFVPAETEKLETVQEFVEAELDKWDCAPRTRIQLSVAVDEIFANIASYAYVPEHGDAEIQLEVLEDPRRLELRFLDSGVPFDPLTREDADTSPEALQSRVGGLGILIVKKTMDEVRYAYADGKNILTIVKKF